MTVPLPAAAPSPPPLIPAAAPSRGRFPAVASPRRRSLPRPLPRCRCSVAASADDAPFIVAHKKVRRIRVTGRRCRTWTCRLCRWGCPRRPRSKRAGRRRAWCRPCLSSRKALLADDDGEEVASAKLAKAAAAAVHSTSSTSPPILKLGMWGGSHGDYYDLSVMPRHLVSVTIRSGDAIDSIAFSYIGTDFNEHTVGPWGGPWGEEPKKIILGPNEAVKEISGTQGDYESARDVIRSLHIITNFKRYSFGNPRGTSHSFRIPVENNGHIVGFYARSEGWLLNSIGLYIHP